MRIDAAFPSNYVKAADLNGKPVVLTMNHVTTEKVGDNEKPILYFHEAKKGLVLNKTNANIIAAAYGNDTEDWRGERVELFEAQVDFQGRQTSGIRVRIPRRNQAQQAPQRQEPQRSFENENPGEFVQAEEIPF